MKIRLLALFSGAALWLTLPLQAQILAYDNGDSSQYTPQPLGAWGAVNGGYGYNLWTALGGAGSGGTYMENGRQVEGSYSFGVFSANSSYAISRPLTNSITGPVEFDILT